MSAALVARLLFVAEYMPVAAIARATQLPYRQLLNVKNLKSVPKMEYRNPIETLYRKTAYAAMRERGFSSKNATALRGAAPDTIRATMSKMGEQINYLTSGLVKSRLMRDGYAPTAENVRAYWNDAERVIIEGMKSSRRTISEQMDYGTYSNTDTEEI